MIPTHDQREHQAWYNAIRPAEAAGRRVYGADLAAVLRRIPGSAGISRHDVVACTFTERRWALLSARADRQVWGHPNLAILNVPQLGWVSVTDLRPALAALAAAGIPPRSAKVTA